MNTAVQDAATFSPEDQPAADVIDFVEALRSRGLDVPESKARLVSRDGEHSIDLPDELYRVLVFAAINIRADQPIRIMKA